MPVVAPYPVNRCTRSVGRCGSITRSLTVTHQSCASGLLAIDIAGRLLAGDPVNGDEPLALAQW
jgi:3-oxoacyl-[acyl-carrier-protein] synthase-3